MRCLDGVCLDGESVPPTYTDRTEERGAQSQLDSASTRSTVQLGSEVCSVQHSSKEERDALNATGIIQQSPREALDCGVV